MTIKISVSAGNAINCKWWENEPVENSTLNHFFWILQYFFLIFFKQLIKVKTPQIYDVG